MTSLRHARSRHLKIIVVVAIALALFLLTGSFIASASLPYMTAAWPAVRTAFWLRAEDRFRPRGKTLFWFYLAAAASRAVITALGAVGVCVLIAMVTRVRHPPLAFIHAMWMLLIGLEVTSLLGLIAVVLATIRKVPAYVVPDLHALCHGDFASINPAVITKRYLNYAVFVVGLACTTIGLSLGLLAGVLLKSPIPLIVGIIAIIPAYAVASNCAIAPTPLDCWPDLFLPHYPTEEPLDADEA